MKTTMTSKGTVERMLWSHYNIKKSNNNRYATTTITPMMMKLRRWSSDHPIILQVIRITPCNTTWYHGVDEYDDDYVFRPRLRKYVNTILLLSDSELSIPALVERRTRGPNLQNRRRFMKQTNPGIKDIYPDMFLYIQEFVPKVSETDGHYIILKSFSILRRKQSPLPSIVKTQISPTTSPVNVNDSDRKDLYLLRLSECLKHPTKGFSYFRKVPDNNFGYDGAVVISNVLRYKSNMMFVPPAILNLRGNNFGNACIQLLVAAFRSCTSLQNINLYHNNISYSGVKLLADYIEANTELSELALGKNKIGTRAIQCLATSLGKNTSRLRMLNLDDNNISATAIAPFGTMLRHNSNLVVLSLDNNNLGDDGIIALASGLWQNTILSDLIISSNNIGNGGVSYLANVIKYNTGLYEIQLQNNVFDGMGALAIYRAMEYNTSIDTLILDRKYEDRASNPQTNDEVIEYYDSSMTEIIRTMLEEYNDKLDNIWDPKLPPSIQDILTERCDNGCGIAPRKGQRRLMDMFQWLQYQWVVMNK